MPSKKKKISRLRSGEHIGKVESDIFDNSVSGKRFSSHSIAIQVIPLKFGLGDTQTVTKKK